MPLYLDRHDVPGVTAEDLAIAHAADVGVQQNHDVRYLTYWFDPAVETVFCLAEGPSRDAVEAVHREAHGLLAAVLRRGRTRAGERVPRRVPYPPGRHAVCGPRGPCRAVHRYLRIDRAHRTAR